jgi:hypothetical protein
MCRIVYDSSNGRPMSMLHIDRTRWREWKIGDPKPEHLLDPTEYLIMLVGNIGNQNKIIQEDDPYIKSVELYNKAVEG